MVKCGISWPSEAMMLRLGAGYVLQELGDSPNPRWKVWIVFPRAAKDVVMLLVRGVDFNRVAGHYL